MILVEITLSVLVAIILLLILGSVVSVIILIGDYKYYKPIYDSLKNRRFYNNLGQVYSHKFGEEDDGFVWFTKTNDFCLLGDHYLHNEFYTYLNPYSLYWLLKYKKWFKENVDINKLPLW